MGLAVAALRATPPAGAPGAGPTAAVVVATASLDVGAVVTVDDLEVRHLPADAVAHGAAADPDDVTGRQVTAPIAAGEPVLDVRLAPVGLRGVAASTPPGWSAFAVPADAATPPVEVGQQVDLFAPTASAVALDGPAERIADGGLVVAVDDRRVTVAVRPADGPAVAAALAGTTVVLAVAGPPPTGAPR
jgi:Flp pilus assembly protein CpaB